jgi:hypothetical protein
MCDRLAEEEAPADMLARVLTACREEVESFDLYHIGTELAYLAEAVLSSDRAGGRIETVQWVDLRMSGGTNIYSTYLSGRYGFILEMFERLFAADDMVWEYIEVI